jgi:hypothetical protein
MFDTGSCARSRREAGEHGVTKQRERRCGEWLRVCALVCAGAAAATAAITAQAADAIAPSRTGSCGAAPPT